MVKYFTVIGEKMRILDIEYETKDGSLIKGSQIPVCCRVEGHGRLKVSVVCTNPGSCSIRKQCEFR
jgi:hypothetical protein